VAFPAAAWRGWPSALSSGFLSRGNRSAPLGSPVSAACPRPRWLSEPRQRRCWTTTCAVPTGSSRPRKGSAATTQPQVLAGRIWHPQRGAAADQGWFRARAEERRHRARARGGRGLNRGGRVDGSWAVPLAMATAAGSGQQPPKHANTLQRRARLGCLLAPLVVSRLSWLCSRTTTDSLLSPLGQLKQLGRYWGKGLPQPRGRSGAHANPDRAQGEPSPLGTERFAAPVNEQPGGQSLVSAQGPQGSPQPCPVEQSCSGTDRRAAPRSPRPSIGSGNRLSWPTHALRIPQPSWARLRTTCRASDRIRSSPPAFGDCRRQVALRAQRDAAENRSRWHTGKRNRRRTRCAHAPCVGQHEHQPGRAGSSSV